MALKDIFGRPPAPRRLVICTGPCCNQTGDAEALIEGLREAMCLSQLDEAMIGQASCMRRACLGKCTGEPLAYTDPDGIWYHDLTVENLLRIIRDHVLDHRPVAELILVDDD